jgi:MFS family permease
MAAPGTHGRRGGTAQGRNIGGIPNAARRPHLPVPATLRRHREFRRLFGAQAASAFGDRLSLVALPLFMVGAGFSGAQIGLVLGARIGALVVFLLLGGVWADRLPRHRVLVAADLVRMVLRATLAALILAGALPLLALVVIEVLSGAAEAFFRPALTGLVPQTVPEDEIQQGMGLMHLPEHLAVFLGPAVAAGLVATVGAAAAFALDALTFAVSAALIVRLRPRPRAAPAPTAAASPGPAPAVAPAAVAPAPAPDGAEPGGSLLADLRGGWREFRSRTWVWATVAVFSVSLVVSIAPYGTLGPILARQWYGNVEVYGVIAATAGLGAVGGALLGLRWRPERPMVAAFLAVLLWPLLLVALGLGLPLPVVLPVALVGQAGVALFMVWWETALAERIPPHALSRVSSYDWMGSIALLPFGYPLVGLAGEAFGPAPVMLACAGLAFAITALGLLPGDTRRLRRREPALSAAA